MNAMDFAQTAVMLYGEGNIYVIEAADLLFDEDTEGVAIGEH